MTEPTASSSPKPAPTRRRSRTPIALGLAFLIGVLVFFITFQLVNRFRPSASPMKACSPSRSRTQSVDNQAALSVPIVNAAFTGPGDMWNLADQRGKVVLLNIFATWCAPCREEMPAAFGN